MKCRVLARVAAVLSGVVLFAWPAPPADAQTPVPATTGPASALYKSIQAFPLTGGVVRTDALTLKRDRVLMTFTGTFYFAPPVDGHVTGAVFIGQGSVRAEVPPIRFEQDNVRRLLHTDVVESDFKTAVLRFTDDTFEMIGKGAAPGEPTPEATALASTFESGMVKETGANIAGRLTASLLNRETPGFFIAQFDRGKRGRFTCLLDFQARIPVANFGLDGGEKGLIFAFRPDYFSIDVWMAFYSLDDLSRGIATYSDTYDAVETTRYEMDVDLREPAARLRVNARMDLKSRMDGVRAVQFNLSENLSSYHEDRIKLGMHITSARLAGGRPLEFATDPWEGGFTLFLPEAVSKGQAVSVEVQVEGDYMRDIEGVHGNHYPISNTAWYPRHGYLERSTFDLVFHHNKGVKVASAGVRLREGPDPEAKNEIITEYALDVPVAAVTFAMGPFEIETAAGEKLKNVPVPTEIYLMPNSVIYVEGGFMLAEMVNSMRFFNELFGKYPYPVFRAALHPYGFGQGLPTLLLLPPADMAGKSTFSFIAHETSHQWWGDVVLWRSYRDQWLSEGFAQYSGVLYTGRRDKPESARTLIEGLRDSLTSPPRTALGLGTGRLNDVGPLIMGRRLSTRDTADAYSTLIYNKGALVLRMLHFLFTDQATGNGQPFFDMMRDFVRRFENKSASTDDFMAVANEHFAQTPISKRSTLTDLKWFFNQWVYQTYLPSYRLEYAIEAEPDGAFSVKGKVFQQGIPAGEEWFMPLPITMKLGKDKVARTVVFAIGAEAPFALRVPVKPESVELDPDMWVLSEKTSAKLVKAK